MGFDAEERGSLWGLEDRPPAAGGGEGPQPHVLTYVRMLQEAADPSLSLQLLVIWGQKGTRCHPPVPAVGHFPRLGPPRSPVLDQSLSLEVAASDAGLGQT